MHAHNNIALRLSDLSPHVLPEVEAFFVQYAGLNGKQLHELLKPSTHGIS